MTDELTTEMARTIWETSRKDEGTISATGANIIAAALAPLIEARNVHREQQAFDRGYDKAMEGIEARVRGARAESWDEGYRSGHSNAMRRMSDEPNAPTTPNPYKNRGA